ncbi:AEC family transporter [Pararobbsia silviterrae]|uniref:AEC family transporter n=1 Tax=Pararobbsia silviterrae TaxID=1792498 RepID=A0A494XQ14_9BURK|nr:AEC family transporter [Pararobbsia silviterrae]RKP51902.1 AEC family transporter [Pararobbsia silviterrae]
MSALFSIVLPIFALIFAGWGMRRSGISGPTATRELNRFVVFLALPALLFRIVANAHMHDLWQPGFIAAFGLGSLAIFAITLVWQCRRGAHLADASIDGLNSAYANTGFIGFPLCAAAFGHTSLGPATVATILTVCVLFGLALALVEIALQPQASIARAIGRVTWSLAKNPLLLAPVLGAVAAACGVVMPEGIERFLNLLADAASPCALVALGLFVAEKRGRPDWSVLTPLVVLKLVVQPAVTWLLAAYVFRITPGLTAIAVLQSALPTGTGAFMLAEYYGRSSDTTANNVLISTIVSMATISILLTFWGH